MTIFQAVILGIVQGATEFLPISSSGHLVLTRFFFGWVIPKDQAFVFDVLVQVGTLIAVIVYFWQDLWEIARAWFLGLLKRKPFDSKLSLMGWFIILASLPAGAAGLLIKDTIEAAFDSTLAAALFLFLTAGLLVTAERAGKRTRDITEITWKDALLMGFFQLLAVFPGVSRSGSTITGGMLRHLDRPSSARFSFLMAVPIMLAAGLLSVLDLTQVQDVSGFLPPLAAGFITSALTGYLSIRWLLKFLSSRPLYIFAAYVSLLGAFSVISLALL